ncbi:MAG: hypothetical protein M1815_002470 [Lichina confinis]|nr:MAG: hypothetical protein M1815_002470 [Lichina confinis]
MSRDGERWWIYADDRNAVKLAFARIGLREADQSWELRPAEMKQAGPPNEFQANVGSSKSVLRADRIG